MFGAEARCCCCRGQVLANVRGERDRVHWLVFDGDVDPEWAENLNSVLDDNRLLTLPSGERLQIPDNVRILMEVPPLETTRPWTTFWPLTDARACAHVGGLAALCHAGDREPLRHGVVQSRHGHRRHDTAPLPRQAQVSTASLIGIRLGSSGKDEASDPEACLFASPHMDMPWNWCVVTLVVLWIKARAGPAAGVRSERRRGGAGWAS